MNFTILLIMNADLNCSAFCALTFLCFNPYLLHCCDSAIMVDDQAQPKFASCAVHRKSSKTLAGRDEMRQRRFFFCGFCSVHKRQQDRANLVKDTILDLHFLWN